MKNRNKEKMLLVLGLMAFLANGDNYAAASLIGNVAEDLNVTISTAALSVTAYMLSLFGIGTVLGGRMAPKFRLKMKNGFLVSAAALGYVSLFVLSGHDQILALSFCSRP